jgi:hypothetical protein
MFLLATLSTSYMKERLHCQSSYESVHSPFLYAYASLLHQWKHFYKRTQIFQHIDTSCSSTPISTLSATFRCSICSQLVNGQCFLCASCGHGGHLVHMHEWFSSSNIKHRHCPEKDCSCQCLLKQQDLLTMYIHHMQQQQAHAQIPTSFSRVQASRQLSGTVTNGARR